MSQLTIVGPPQGTYCLAATNLTPTGGSCTIDLDSRTGPGQVFNITIPAGYYYITGPRGTYRDSKNELLFDQLDLNATFSTGPDRAYGRRRRIGELGEVHAEQRQRLSQCRWQQSLCLRPARTERDGALPLYQHRQPQ